MNLKYIRRRFHIYIEFNDLHNAFAELFRLFTSTKFPGYECKVFIKKLLIKWTTESEENSDNDISRKGEFK